MRATGFGVLATLVIVSPALVISAAAQVKRPGGGGAPAAPAPHISAPAPAPRISAPAPAPHFSAPAPHVGGPAFSAPHTSSPAPRAVSPAPHIAAPAPHIAPAPRFAAPQRLNTPHVAAPRIAPHGGAQPRMAHAPAGPNRPAGLATRNVGPRGGNALTATPRNLPRNVRTAVPRTSTPGTVGQGAAGAARTVGQGATGQKGAATVGQGPAARGRDTVGQGPATGARNIAASQALVRAPNGRLGVRNPTLASLPARDPATRALARSAFSGRFAQSRTAWDHDWRSRHHHRHNIPFVLGFVGSVFWPYAYDDFVDYTFADYGYDTFWPYAYDDFYSGIYGGYAPELYADASDVTGTVQGGGSARRGRARVATAAPGAGAGGAAQICSGETQGLTDFPIQRIAQQVQPDQNQQALLDELKAATQQAVEILRSACPTELPTTPPGRLAATRQRVEAMLRALQAVRPALDKFYAALTDEQKQRFNALDAATVAAGSQTPDACGQGTSALEQPISRIEKLLHLSAAQEAAFNELKDASAKAREVLTQNCPAGQPLTPPGRLAAMEQRLTAMLQAIDTMQPALAKFYNSLSDEQKAQLSRIGPRAA